MLEKKKSLGLHINLGVPRRQTYVGSSANNLPRSGCSATGLRLKTVHACL